MIYNATERIDLPNLDLLTFLFESPWCGAKEETKIHTEAANPSNTITKAQARDLLRRIGHGLRRDFGIGASAQGKDAIVCTASGNVLTPILFYGIICAGGVFSSASTAFRTAEIVRQIKQGKSRLLACTPEFKDIYVEAAKECDIPLNRILIMDSTSPAKWTLKDVETGKDHISNEMMDWERITERSLLFDRTISLLYSSGTTGPPKGVLLSHMNLIAEGMTAMHHGKRYMEKKEARGETFEFRTIAHLPTAHIAGLQQYLVNPFYMGGTTYWMPKYEFDKFLEYNKQYRITHFFTVPPICLDIAKSDKVTDHFATLENVSVGAAPLGAQLQNAASQKLGGRDLFISQTWGLTETTGSVTILPWDEVEKTGSISPPMPNVSLKLIDDDGNHVKPGDPGEICVKGEIVSKGYNDNPEATAASFIDGWFHTGDVAVYRDNMFYIVDRKKELIKYKGLQVAPAELEAILISHPNIMDAAVIGVDYEETEAPRAYCVKSGEISEDEVKSFIRKEMASHKQLRGGVRFVNAIPKSASGKILRKDLREMAKRDDKAKL